MRVGISATIEGVRCFNVEMGKVLFGFSEKIRDGIFNLRRGEMREMGISYAIEMPID